ncbi:MAG: BlaI/MecI/CopY family transcriptional regulator [Thermoanaerobaculia bacterium]
MPRAIHAPDHLHLSRRERQIMDILYREGRAAAGEVLERLPDPPGYSAVRAMLRVLENKGHLTHVLEDGRYVYRPIVPRNRARRSALENLLETFFDGSAEKAVAALLSESRNPLGEEELERLSHLIADARKEGR